MRYWLFRTLVTPVDTDSLFAPELDSKGRNEAAKQVYKSSVAARHNGISYRFYNLRQIHRDGSVAGIIARPRQAGLARASPDSPDLIEQSVESQEWTPFVYDAINQTIAIGEKSDFYNGERSKYKDLVEKVLNRGFDTPGYTIRVVPINRTEDFANAVEECERLTRVNFTLITPNIGKGNKNLKESLEILKTNTNANELTTTISNKEGKLNKDGVFERYAEEIDYTTSGMGEWKIRGKAPDGTPITRSSSTTIASVTVSSHGGHLETLLELSGIILEYIRDFFRMKY